MTSTFDIPPEERLLKLAASGDSDALGRLLESHRQRLERMVCVRLDHRIQKPRECFGRDSGDIH